MKIGENIREIREFEKNFKRSYVAVKLNLSTRAYANIENDVSDVSISRLQQIASIFECTPQYILNYKSSKKDFYNYFHNNNGNKGVNIMHQGGDDSSSKKEKVYELQNELLESEKKRILLLEALLERNKIDY